MALPGLVRVTTVAKLLGTRPQNVARWCRRLGIPLAQAPVRGVPKAKPPGTPGRGGGPLYLSVSEGARLLDAMMPGLANLAERRDTYVKLRRQATRERATSKNVQNEVMWEK